MTIAQVATVIQQILAKVRAIEANVLRLKKGGG